LPFALADEELVDEEVDDERLLWRPPSSSMRTKPVSGQCTGTVAPGDGGECGGDADAAAITVAMAQFLSLVRILGALECVFAAVLGFRL